MPLTTTPCHFCDIASGGRAAGGVAAAVGPPPESTAAQVQPRAARTPTPAGPGRPLPSVTTTKGAIASALLGRAATDRHPLITAAAMTADKVKLVRGFTSKRLRRGEAVPLDLHDPGS